MIAMRAWLLLAVVGCSGAQRAGSPSELGCTQDPAARSACEAQGSGYVYGSEPDFGCTGNDPGPEGQAEIEKARNARPCACMTSVDYAERQERCANMP